MAEAHEENIIPDEEDDVPIGDEEISAGEDDMPHHAVEDMPSIIDTFSGQQKATALLVAMGTPAASRLIRQLDADDLRRLKGQARKLPDIKVADFEKLVTEFENAFAEGASLSRAEERFTTLVQETLPEDEAAAVLNSVLPAPTAPMSVFETITGMTAGELHQYLASEHPQVVAYVVSRLPNELAAKILLMQPAPVRFNIVQRTLHLKPVQPAADAIISHAWYPELEKQPGNREKSHYRQVAMILNHLDRNELDDVMRSLKGLKPQDLAGIRACMFAFEDVARLTNRARLILFDNIVPDVIIKALRGADQALVDLILASLSPRIRRMVAAEIAMPDEQLSRTGIMRARRDIAMAALNLAEKEIISLAEEGANA